MVELLEQYPGRVDSVEFGTEVYRIPASPLSSQLPIPRDDLLVESANQRSHVIVGDVRYDVIFGSLRDYLLGRDVFESEG